MTARAYQWATQVMTICLEMVLPGLLGYWLDQRWGTKALFTVVGFAVGMGAGMWHLIRLARTESVSAGDGDNGKKRDGR